MGALDCVQNDKIGDSTEQFSVNLSSSSTLNEQRRDLESQQTQNKTGTRCRILWKIFVDVPLFILILAVIYLFQAGILPANKAGFYCNDPALSFKFQGDTVSSAVLIASVIAIPLIVIFITEAIFSPSDYSVRHRLLHITKTTFVFYRNYVIGLYFNVGLVEFIKIVAGRPRPNFFDVCRPDTALTCNGTEFVKDFECTSDYSRSMQLDSYRSFPSGHTSLSVCCGFYVVWYLQSRSFSWRRRVICVVPILQLLCIYYATVCSLTRLSDHRHHWWDVCAGFVIGICSATYSILMSRKIAIRHNKTITSRL